MSNTKADSLSRRAASGASWLIGARFATKAIDFVTLLFAARLLSPDQFGIVALAMTPIFIVEAVFELPLFQVLVREEITDELLHTCFTLSVMRGVGLAATLVALSYPLSVFYGDPRLVWMISVLSIAPAVRGLWSPRAAIYAKALDFRRDVAIDVLSKLVAGIASVSAAFYLRDFRALIIGTVILPCAIVAISYALAPFRPRFSLKGWRVFSGFIAWSTASQIFAAINWQCDRLLLGRFVSASQLGAFAVANDLSYLPEQALIKPIARPLMSAFGVIRNERERLAIAYSKTALTILAVGAPVMVGLSCLSGPAVALVLGPKWISAGPILRWLSLTLIPALFIAPLAPLAMAIGKPEAATHQSIGEAVVKLPTMLVGAMFFGVWGVIVARAISAVAAAVVSFWLVRRLIGTPIWRQIASSWRILVSCAALAGTLLVANPLLVGASTFKAALLIPPIAGAGMLVYAVTLFALWWACGEPDGLESGIVHKARQLWRSRFPKAEARLS